MLQSISPGKFLCPFIRIALFTINSAHLHVNEIYHVCEAISGYFVVLARNCLQSTLNYIVMQMRKTYFEKGFWFSICFPISSVVLKSITGSYIHIMPHLRTSSFSVELRCMWLHRHKKHLLSSHFNKLNINLISKQAGMTRFRGVIEFAPFVALILKMRITFCLIAQNIHQLETNFLTK